LLQEQLGPGHFHPWLNGGRGQTSDFRKERSAFQDKAEDDRIFLGGSADFQGIAYREGTGTGKHGVNKKLHQFGQEK
jgi:hypothetical protein